MTLIILLSFVGVFWLWQHYGDSCNPMEYTYCGESGANHH